MMCLIYLLEILATQMAVKAGMYEVANVFGANNLFTNIVTNSQMESQLQEVIGEESLDSSIIVNGSNGFDLSGTQINYGTGVVQLVVDYKIELPVPYFKELGLNYTEKVLFKR